MLECPTELDKAPISFLRGRRVVVTGGSGLVGRRIVDLLAKRGVKETIVYDICESPVNKDFEDPEVHDAPIPTFVKGDICNAQALKEACRNVDVVFHAAAMIDISPVTNPIIFDVNVGGTQNVIDACIANNVKVLVATSSIEVAGLGPFVAENEPYPEPRDENSEPVENISTHYAKSKRQGENLVLAAHGTKTNDGSTLATVCIRPGLIVDRLPGCVALGNALDRSHQLGGILHLYKTPAALSWVHAHNAALVHVCAAERARLNNSVGGQVFHAVDFNENLVDVYQEVLSEIPEIKIMMLPLWLVMVATWILDKCFRLMNAFSMVFFRYRMKPNVWCLGYNAARITFHDFCFTNALAQKHLEYNSLHSNGGVPVKTREATIADAKECAKRYYTQLKQGRSMSYTVVSSFVPVSAGAKLWVSRVFGAWARLAGGISNSSIPSFQPNWFLHQHGSLTEAKSNNRFALGVQHYYQQIMVELVQDPTGSSLCRFGEQQLWETRQRW